MAKKVFISSTSKDLKKYRQAVAKLVENLGFSPIVMDEFPASDEHAVQVCHDHIKQADVFIGIYAHRYGEVPKGIHYRPDPNSPVLPVNGMWSITHYEYEWARRSGIPKLIFVAREECRDFDDSIDPLEKTKMDRFKQELGKRHTWKEFCTLDELEDGVRRSLQVAPTTPPFNEPIEFPQDTQVCIVTSDSLRNRAERKLLNFTVPDLKTHLVSWHEDMDFKGLSEQDVVFVLEQQRTDKEWKGLVERVRAINPYTEFILVANQQQQLTQESVTALAALREGYFAYFEGDFEPDVLTAYIESARQNIISRRLRRESSFALSRNLHSVEAICNVILEQLRVLVGLSDGDKVTIVRLSKRDYIQEENPLKKLVRTLLDHNYPKSMVKWDYLRPIKDDPLMLALLQGDIKGLIFPDGAFDPRIETYFEDKSIQSWIVLPLVLNNVPIGIVTVDSPTRGKFRHETLSETTLKQFANQAAVALRVAEKTETTQRLQEKALMTLQAQTSLEDILRELSRQACEIVDGLFSYVVMVDDSNANQLVLRAAYDRYNVPTFQKDFKYWLDKYGGFVVRRGDDQPRGVTVIAYQRGNESPFFILDDYQSKFGKALHEHHDPFGLYGNYLNYPYETPDGSKKLPTGSELAVPILLGDQVIGVLNVEHENPCAFTAEQIEALVLLSKYAAIAIEQEKKRERIYRSKRLYDAMSLSLKQLQSAERQGNELRALAQATKSASRADKGVKIFEKIDNITVLRGWSDDVDTSLEHQTRPIGQGHTSWVITHNRHIQIPDVNAFHPDPAVPVNTAGGYRSIPINPDSINAGHRALLCLPMRFEGKPIGAVWMHFGNPQEFTDEELEDLQRYADFMAVALHNHVEQKLLKIGEAISKADQDSNQTTQMMVDYVKDRFGVKGVLFYQDVPEEQYLVRLAATKTKGGEPFLELGRKLSYDTTNGELVGLVPNLFVGRHTDSDGETKRIYHVPDYSAYPYKTEEWEILGDDGKPRLQSVLGAILRAPITKERIGVLVLAGRAGRTFDESKEEFKRFMRIAGNLLTLRSRIK